MTEFGYQRGRIYCKGVMDFMDGQEMECERRCIKRVGQCGRRASEGELELMDGQ